MKKGWKAYKKLHKWPGLIISFFIIYYGVTGVILNHRQAFSGIDISRNFLPQEFKYENWNNGALKGNLIVSSDSILVYGNIGIWVTDSAFYHYTPLNNGFPNGSDNKKIFDLHRTDDGNLYAANQFGLYAYNIEESKWVKFNLKLDINKFVAIESLGDTIYALNRSFLFKGKSNGSLTNFKKVELAKPDGYSNKLSLLKTLWQLHSGEIFGISGKLLIDLMGIISVFLSITAVILFFFPKWVVRRKAKGAEVKQVVNINKWSLKWHNKAGAWLFIVLIGLFATGMFLRPPLLISIANAYVSPMSYTHLDQPNPWYDKLRDVIYDKERGIFLLSTSDGMYYFKKDELKPHLFTVQPPVSVMGINVFEPFEGGAYLIGSFSGLFLWHPSQPEILNYAQGNIYHGNKSGRPIGDFKVTGVITDTNKKQYMVDYDKGIIPLWHDQFIPQMPMNVIHKSKISLWNLSLEIHTGRIFKSLIGDFYILLVPLSGLISIMVLISGYILWKRKFKRKHL